MSGVLIGEMALSSITTADAATAMLPRKTTTIEKPLPPKCKIGGKGPGGGIVFYISKTKINVQPGISLGGRCLEAAPKTWAGTASDPATQWGCYGTSAGTSSGIGTGAANTAKIIASCATPGIAARWAGDLTFGGKSDWFLPSISEMNPMSANLPRVGVGGIYYGLYWSSSESNVISAWLEGFGGYDGDAGSKSGGAYVRPIRVFG